MKRRKLLGLTGAGLMTTLVTGWTIEFQADSAQPSRKSKPRTQSGNSLSIQWLGHSCFLFSGGGVRILANPFRPLGCTAKYRPPKVAADLVMISSQLLDEGSTDGLPGSPRLIYEPGVYQFNGIKLQGISMDHDRIGGKRFGTNVAWRWTQAGINILNLGGAAAPITVDQKILMEGPDVMLVPVGGGPKAYNPEEAKQAIQTLNPKLIIPTQFRTQAADANCDLAPLDAFLSVMSGFQVRHSNTDTISLTPADLPSSGPVIQAFSYKS
ncbi:MAG: MBL fold metallo-hydrolase [Chroococcidiopsidaceae cyanobacterium CP_BM_ER_R8_30]|nr:MBL fold metallo-hydrolase [Chroococcidiopsidaceae cyanobacterium CP_BM_ER_R8_30]